MTVRGFKTPRQLEKEHRKYCEQKLQFYQKLYYTILAASGLVILMMASF